MTHAQVNITFFDNEGNDRELSCTSGATILQIARQFDLPLEAECEGTLSCSTCHVVIDSEFYGKLKPASVDEGDLLDTAHNVTCTSRLGCQVHVNAELDGMKISLPSNL